MRAILGVLLLANLVAAVIVFKPFGGSADDLRRGSSSRSSAQLAQFAGAARQHQEAGGKGADRRARRAISSWASTSWTSPPCRPPSCTELTNIAKEAGITMGQATLNSEPIEGSDTLVMLTMQVGFEGTYANLTKFVNLVDKSPRFLIIENHAGRRAAAAGRAAAERDAEDRHVS